MEKILSAPLLIIIPAGQNEAPAGVSYDSPFIDLGIRWRLNGGPWRSQGLNRPNELDATGQPSPDTTRKGEFFISVSRGGKVEIEAWPLDNIRLVNNWPVGTGNADRLDALTILGVRDRVEFRLSEPFAPEVGGTYWWARVAVIASSPWVRLQIGFKRPVSNNGILEIPDVIPEREQISDEAPVHELEVDTLLPGNELFYVLTIADVGSTGSGGDWQQLSGAFKTLQRGALIFIKEIKFTNAGDSGDGGPGSFAFQIREGGFQVSDTLLKDFSFTIQHFNDGETVDLSPHGTAFLIAPKKVTPSSKQILIHLRGVEHDGWPDVSDVSTSLFNQPVSLDFPSGRFKEKFTDKMQKIHATYGGRGSGKDEFAFHVNVQYSSIYMP